MLKYRRKDEIILTVMESIKLLQHQGGPIQNDIIHMSGLNQKYFKHIEHILKRNYLVYTSDSKPYHYFLTKLGLDTYKRLSKVMKDSTGFIPRLNGFKVKTNEVS